MPRAAYIDLLSFRDQEGGSDLASSFIPGAISGLTLIARKLPMILIAAESSVEESADILRLLAKEGVAFGESITPDDFVKMLRDDRLGSDIVFAGTQLGRSLRPTDSRPTVVEPLAIGWAEAAARLELPDRVARVKRQTSETSIEVTLNLDGRGLAEVETGIGFFDHMLEQVARHSGIDLYIQAAGDLHIDEHHTIEDTAIAIGDAFREAGGDKRGIQRYAFLLPMDESLAQVALDLSGRPTLVWQVELRRERIGDMPTEMVQHFFKSFTDASRSTLNISCSGENEHHIVESVFKAFGRCLGQSVRRRVGDRSVPSTKGVL